MINKLCQRVIVLLLTNLLCFGNVFAQVEEKTFPRLCIEQLQTMTKEYQQLFKTQHNWSQPSYDQSQWPFVALDYLEKTGTVCWTRTHVNISEDPTLRPHQGLEVAQIGAYEVYWDGILIGGSGKVGYSKNQEQAGSLRTYITIPKKLFTPGHHVIGIKNSNFHRLPWLTDYNYKLEFVPPPSINLSLSAPYLWSLISLGCCFLIACYYLSHYFLVEQELAYLLFSLLSFLVAAFAAVSITYYIDMPYYLFKIATTSAVSLAALSCWLLPVFMAVLYQNNYRWRFGLLAAVIVCVGLLLPISWTLKTVFGFGGCLLLSLYLVIVAIKQQKSGAIAVFVGISTLFFALLYQPENFITQRFSLLFCLLIACLLMSLSLQIKQMKSSFEQAKLTAAKLEIALLKKNIQPHFLMNTLTSIIECLEFDKQKGIEFINALAQEFNLICQVSDKQQILLADELKLCQYHLQIMSFQQQIDYQLQLHNIDSQQMIPPGVFHTLVENGISHNIYRREKVIFSLTSTPLDKGIRYTFITPTADQQQKNKLGSGMGSKYIKMSLQESYGANWTLSQQATEHGWRTIIDIHKN
ncbi:MAG: histidine kinase [Colwellia sp.]|nr:histidine kinase [Colwellia sp.]